MRGLTGGSGVGPGSTGALGSLQAASTAVAMVAALALLVSACGTGGTGARDEGPADADSVAVVPSAVPSPSDTPRPVNAVQLIRRDPEVSAAVKRNLRPCVADAYPIDVSYGKLTGGAVDDIVVNVLTCGEAVGLGSYVYRRRGKRYENVFRTEEPPVYARIDRGDLVVTRQVYEKGDPVSNPSGEDVITYRWSGTRFVQEFVTRNEYSKAVGGGATTAPTPDD